MPQGVQSRRLFCFGYNQDFREDRAWVIQFSRGENLSQVQYGLQSGLYTFASTDQGWELYRSDSP
jgi:hypothetical protein